MKKLNSFLFSGIVLIGVLNSCSSESDAEPQAENTQAISTNTVTTPSGLTHKSTGVAGIAGVNWADGRDNFVDGWVIPSGLEAGDSYAAVEAKTNAILNAFATNINGVNTIRIPINPPSVSESWWNSYSAVIDKATSKGWNVIICCWESNSSRDGKIDDTTKFWAMWRTVVVKYTGNSKVYFEVFNEPHGYTLSQLKTIYNDFLVKYPSVPRGRILLSGTGYSDDVKGVGADSRFSSCLLSLHNYAFWATRTVSAWQTDWRNRMGNYASRTVITEFGATMNSGKDYQNGSQSDNEIAYIVSTSDVCRTDKVASVYWPGLRDGDSYSLQSRGGSGTNITLSTVNASGVFRLRYGWGLN